MKKNIFLILICICVFCINVSGVLAVSDNGSAKYPLAMTKSKSVKIPTLGKNGYFYIDTINGKRAFCIELGKPAKNGDIYQNTGVEITDYWIRKAYNYGIKYTDEYSLLAAQVYIWATLDGKHGLMSTAYKEAFISIWLNENSADYMYDLAERSGMERYNAIADTSAYSGKLCKFVNLTRSGGQAMVAPCTDMTLTVYACDDGTMQTEVTACTNGLVNNGQSLATALSICKNRYCPAPTTTGSCKNGQMVESGDIPQCSDNNSTTQANFNTSATVGSNTSVHQNYGQVENVSGLSKYCKLYCVESGKVILPGGFANALTSGTNVVWPTSANTESSPFGNIFPLYFSGKKTCHLAIQDRNAPQGSSAEGDCFLNPLGDYEEKYIDAVNYNNSHSDLNGSKYEAVRRHSDFVQTGSCGGDTVKGLDYSAYYYEVVKSGYYSKNSNANRLREELKSAALNYVDKERAARNYSPKEERYTGTCKQTSLEGDTITVSCTKYRETEGYKSAKRTRDNALNAYNNAKNLYESKVKKSIDECNTYINKFNTAKNLANEIAKCYNYEINACNAGSSNQDDCIYNFKASATLNFEDSEYSMSDVLKQVNDVRYDCDGCSVSSKMTSTAIESDGRDRLYIPAEMDRKIREIQARRITISTNNVKFELNSPYKYVDKKTNQPLTSPTDNSVSLGYSFLPLSHNNILGKKYNIGLSNIVFGDTAAGSNVATFEASSDYVCHYSVTGTNDECLCPEGTENAGEDLFYFVKTESLTCADAKLKYCDATGTDFSDDKSEKYCPNDMTKKITACLNSGYSYNYCVDLICVGSVDSSYHCKNTNGVSGAMDITSCVYTKMAQGYSLQESIDECDSLICPLAGGIKIIYRTISLRNPFPGKDIAKQVNGFNQDVKGRYPGTNWNSLELVKNEILYNRGVEGNSVYKKEPLYRFELSPSTMKAIRNYNDTRDAAGGYADYTLNCRNNNSTACVSSFVHNAEYGLIGGTCANATSKNNFYTCSQ